MESSPQSEAHRPLASQVRSFGFGLGPQRTSVASEPQPGCQLFDACDEALLRCSKPPQASAAASVPAGALT